MARSKNLGMNVLAGLAGAAVALSTVGGCAYMMGQEPGGRGASLDQFSYVSTPFAPMTVTLRDVRDGSEIWSLDVPVNRKLIVRFDHADDKHSDTLRPDVMCWDVVGVDDWSSLENEIPVPADPMRRLEVTLRDTPEYADASVPFTTIEPEEEVTAQTPPPAAASSEPMVDTPVAPRQPEDVPPASSEDPDVPELDLEDIEVRPAPSDPVDPDPEIDAGTEPLLSEPD